MRNQRVLDAIERASASHQWEDGLENSNRDLFVVEQLLNRMATRGSFFITSMRNYSRSFHI